MKNKIFAKSTSGNNVKGMDFYVQDLGGEIYSKK